MEVPDKISAPFHQLVHISLCADVFDIGAGVASGDAERQTIALKQIHGVNGSLICAIAPTGVRRFFKAFHTDNRHKILYFQHVLCKLFVDQSSVGKAHKDGVRMLFAELNQVFFPHQGFTAGVDIEVSAHFLTLANDIINFIIGQVQLVAVLRGPTSLAMKVAGRGGVQQDGPGHVAVVLGAVLVLLFPAGDAGVEEEVGQ